MSWGSEEGAHMLMSLSYCELKRAATQGLALLGSLARGGPGKPAVHWATGVVLSEPRRLWQRTSPPEPPTRL